MAGNNEDTWKVNAKTWFEKSVNDRYLAMEADTLFMGNDDKYREYRRFVHFKTPFNSPFIKLLLYFMELLLLLLTLFWVVYNLKALFSGKSNTKTNYGMWLLLIVNMVVAGYLFVLQNNQPIFYFDAPYYVDGEMMLNVMAYIPVALLGLIIPIGLANIRVVNRPAITIFVQRIFTLNTIIYLCALLLFAYWGLLFIVRS